MMDLLMQQLGSSATLSDSGTWKYITYAAVVKYSAHNHMHSSETLNVIINVLIKVKLNVIRCRGTLQSQWSKLTDSTSRKAEDNVNVTDDSRSSWYVA